MPATKAVNAHRIFGLITRGALLSRNFLKPSTREIGMLGDNRPVDKPDFYFGSIEVDPGFGTIG